MDAKLEYLGGMTTANSYHRKYEHKETGIHSELFTKRKHDRPVEGSAERTWYHPEDPESWGTFEQALESAIKLGLIKEMKGK